MTLNELFRATIGQAPEGYSVVKSVVDATRHLDILKGAAGDLLFSFFPTLGDAYIHPGETPKSWIRHAADWIVDAQAWQKAYTVGSKVYRAHAGFVFEYLTFRDEINTQMIIHQPRKVTVVGFSQGAAHATLCHRDLLHNYEGVEVYTRAFASPRVYGPVSGCEFDNRSIDRIQSSFERVTVHGDLVARLAPWWMGYAHVGPETVVGGKGHWWLIGDPAKHEAQAYLAALEGK